MYLLNDALVTSASDLKLASECEFALLRTLDVKLGRAVAVEVEADAMLERAARLGDRHEERIVEALRDEPGSDVVALPRPENARDADELRRLAVQTLEALHSGAGFVYQAVFFDESDPELLFVGFADFLARQPDGRYRVQDSKLARSAKVTALLQLAAYHEQLRRLGVPVDDEVELILGDGRSSIHHIDDIRPVFELRRERLHGIIREHRAEPGAVDWGDARYAADGRCEVCAAEVDAHRDLFLVAGMRATQRAKLRAGGLTTIDDLARAAEQPEGSTVPAATYRALHEQAALQVSAMAAEALAGESSDAATAHAVPAFRMFAPQIIADLPAPDPGDIYFDFEGDPLHQELAADGVTSLWGLDYLFGYIDDAEQFTSYLAHDLAAEAVALRAFLDDVKLRRQANPGMHIYHYASYERTHLASIAARHGVGEADVDELLSAGVLVDLYPVVKRSIRVASRSYSIKKLEPLYMGDELRTQDGVTNAADSVIQYAVSRQAAQLGDLEEAQRILDDIIDYNRYDCVSTRRLRDWLIEVARAEAGVEPGTGGERAPDAERTFRLDPLTPALLARAERRVAVHDADGAAANRLAAAAIDYHRREDKSFWWAHFERLESDAIDWMGTRDVFEVDAALSTVEQDWTEPGPGQRASRRRVRLRGAWAPGSSARPGRVFAIYRPAVYAKAGRDPRHALDHGATIEEIGDDGSVLLAETLPGAAPGAPGGPGADIEPWNALPIALTPGPPPMTEGHRAAIEEWGARVDALGDGWPLDPASDILLRRAPRLRDGAALEPMRDADDGVRAVVASLRRMDDSYLAVQGPPGTGKTYLAAHVIAELVAQGWMIGVVAQSHRVVENVLDGVVRAGCAPAQVGKGIPSSEGAGYYDDHAFTELSGSNPQAAFLARHRDAGRGAVIGGTGWDFVNTKRVGRRELDLLVIDEAGQFSLANTIAVAQAAHRILLLGDPQQLPQVSQGVHPAPIDASALGAISAGHEVLPAEYGYFLAASRRMDAAVTRPVSRLAYAGELRSHPSTARRHLEGAPPGFEAIPLAHTGNATASLEEAQEVLAQVRAHLGLRWTDEDAGRADDPLTESDLIVVAPYNAQVELIHETLAAAGLERVRVGTVDRFQGQEAVVAIVSLAASSPDDAPRGLDFLLSRNRLNVAISRAQWAARLIYSPRLLDHLPWKPDGVAELSRFVRLVRGES
ncbi:bifunctional RecB family nuclease/DEAD/DEAH box helicase [Schumannella sp. 10F1B-5-1]|uniref:TM0106 family RecB-like putative nuclease n=1 Tax=Schumannella sp. 10F1B-5-1 TaxID=2590780 RepID=UPI00113269F3|nr:bifunctional RecB family nuclease/DEAD/DEAH box helicase [Schumannella sp. 10F1B-5-1]TPW72854.1 TM0106 family RecB-like putative nuclease [Schumannella sp. 10F1B-5-1]